jgi:hypothetical protein
MSNKIKLDSLYGEQQDPQSKPLRTRDILLILTGTCLLVLLGYAAGVGWI